MDNSTFIPLAYQEKLRHILPKHLSIEDTLHYLQRPLRKSIRVNTLKTSVSDFKHIMDDLGWQYYVIPWCDTGFFIDAQDSQGNEVNLGNHIFHALGLYYIQEASSMLPPAALESSLTQSPDLVLDMASAPGSKTTQLAAILHGAEKPQNSTLIANEYSASRCKALHHNLQRIGVSQYAMTQFDAAVFGEYTQSRFDAILLDTPCSGEGTVRRDIHALKNWHPSLPEDMAQVQKKLFVSAFHALKVGGTLVYSTCTLSPEENQHVCHAMLQTFKGCLQIEPLNTLFPQAHQCTTEEGFLHLWPQLFDTGGFFVAKFKKIAEPATKPDAKRTKAKRAVFTPLAPAMYQSLSQFLNIQFGFDTTLLDAQRCMKKGEDIWYLPPHATQIQEALRCDRLGYRIAEVLKKGFKLHHDFIAIHGQNATDHRVELNSEDAIAFLQGKDVRPDQVINSTDTTNKKTQSKQQTNEVICYYRGFSLGMGKRIGTRIKNNLPRELVRDSAYIAPQ